MVRTSFNTPMGPSKKKQVASSTTPRRRSSRDLQARNNPAAKRAKTDGVSSSSPIEISDPPQPRSPTPSPSPPPQTRSLAPSPSHHLSQEQLHLQAPHLHLPIPSLYKKEKPMMMKDTLKLLAEGKNQLPERQNELHNSIKARVMLRECIMLNISQKLGMTKDEMYHTPDLAENAQCLRSSMFMNIPIHITHFP